MARVFLAVVGTLYIVLGVWCAAMPVETAESVGFRLIGGSGLSEFFVVYGGLELALGIMFLSPLRHPDDTDFALRLCSVVHSCLVAFRTASLIRFDDISRTTYILAAGEWLILLATIFVWWQSRPSASAGTVDETASS